MCSWCWAFRPTLTRFLKQLPSDILRTKLLGGLAPDTDQAMDVSMRNRLQETWGNIQKKLPETQFNYDFWVKNVPRRSTYPACRAVIAAREIDQTHEDKMIFAIQQGYYLRALNPSDDDTLIKLAAEIGINQSQFSTLFYSDTVANQLFDEIALSRSMGARSFPSLILQVNSGYWPVAIDYYDENVMLEAVFHLVPESY
ncbi:MAG: DsbA family protein [Chromatiales bacterium]|nr:DsbA family protein [Chromatiales bacterium]